MGFTSRSKKMGALKMEKLDLDNIRQQIDKVDHQLAAILEARLNLVLQVADYKKSQGLPVKDKAREAKVIAKTVSYLENQKYKNAVGNIMRSIIEQACILEENVLDDNLKNLTIACFGSAGSFSHQALEEYFVQQKHTCIHYNTFEEVISNVASGKTAYGVLPIENSSTGGITEVYDLLRHYDCHIIGEHCIKIEQNLLGCNGASLNTVKKVYSHPQGFKQCSNFFHDYEHIEQLPFFSTSKSAEEVALKQDISLGAVAGKMAADLYNLQIIAPAINSNNNNCTRFIIIAKEAVSNIQADKITMIVAVKHETGSLYKILEEFYNAGLNLINLESRPMEGKSWEYFFYIDVIGHLEDSAIKQVMQNIESKTTYLKILGNYCKFTGMKNGK